MFHPSLSGLVILLVPAAVLGCAQVKSRTPPVPQPGAQYSQLELQVDVVEVGREMMQTVEIAADSIDSLTTDPILRRNTLLWRISSIPAATEAALRTDPVIGMLDLYGLALQQADFLASPAGSGALGPGVVVAQQSIERLQARWRAVVAGVGVTIADSNRVKLAAWAREHPIDRLPFVRSSLAGTLAIRLRNENASLGAAVGGMQGSLDRVEARMSLANEYLAKQIAWMGRLAALDLRGSPEAEELMRTLSSTRGLLGSGPDLIARERQAALAEVDRQLQMTLADVDRQRRATLALLSGERAILLQAVAHERALVLAAVDEQRRLAVQDGDSLLARLVAEEIRVVDHLLLRVAALFGVLLLVLGAWSLLRRYRVPAPIR